MDCDGNMETYSLITAIPAIVNLTVLNYYWGHLCHITLWIFRMQNLNITSMWIKQIAYFRTRCQENSHLTIPSDISNLMKLGWVDIKINCNILKLIAKAVNNTSQFQFWKYLLPCRLLLAWASAYLQMLLKLSETGTDIGGGNCEECFFDFIKSVLEECRWA